MSSSLVLCPLLNFKKQNYHFNPFLEAIDGLCAEMQQLFEILKQTGSEGIV